MADEPNSLSDDQINADYRDDPSFLPNLVKEMTTLDDRIKDAGEGEEVSVPVESLRAMRMGMNAIVKAQTEFAGFGDHDRGNRGANCDYNPFNKIDIGDL
jgi:hypothetical protein